MERMNRILDGLEREWKLNLLWKYVGVGRTSCGLAERHTYHCCGFCRNIKSRREGLRLCSENDEILLPRRAEQEKGVFLSTCHAGVSEVVVPLFEGTRCTEVFLAGIFLPVSADPAEFPGVERIGEERWKRIASVLEDLAVVFRERRETIRRESVRRDEIHDLRIQRAVEGMEKHFSRAIRIRDLAAEACLSESRFLHLFRKETGRSAIAFLTECRLKAARQMLERSDASIAQVMEQCGFRDQSHFGKLFREFTGYSPLVYHRTFRRRGDV